jgi:peptide/nickel transport system permease protein
MIATSPTSQRIVRSKLAVTRLRVPLPPFVRFVLRRLAALVLLALGTTIIAFGFTQLVPGDPAAANLGEQAAADPAAVAAY